MALVNYKAKNNASTTMASGISAGAVSMIVATGAGDLFPTTFPFELTLEQFTGSNVTKREIVKCTARTGDTLTIVRSWDYCPASYTALTQTNTAYAFSTGDTVSLRITASMIEDIYAELVQLRTDLLPLAGGAMTGLLKEAQGATIASATTTDLSTATGNSVTVSGTTTITGFGTVQAGTTIKITFSGVLILTHNAVSLILPNATSNITTAVGDSCIVVSLGSGNWKCLSYTRANGTSLVSASAGSATTSAEGIAEIATTAEALLFADTTRIITAESLGLATTIPEQSIEYESGSVTQTVTNFHFASSIDGSIAFITYNNAAGTTAQIYRLQKDNYTGQYWITHKTSLSGASTVSNPAVIPTSTYLYLAYSDGGTHSMRRYSLADLSGVTTITVSGTGWTTGKAGFSDGTNLYVSNGSNSFRKYTISGTTATHDSAITYTSAGDAQGGGACCDGTNVWITAGGATPTVIRKYALAGGAATATVSPWVQYDAHSGTFSGLRLFLPKVGALGIAWAYGQHDASTMVGSIMKLVSVARN